MAKRDAGVPAGVSKYMAELGAKGGAAAKGKSKRRGGAAHYKRVAEARWGKKKEKRDA